jgi:hypothetical protein
MVKPTAHATQFTPREIATNVLEALAFVVRGTRADGMRRSRLANSG